MAFKIIRNDITKVHADAIVNTANPKPIFAEGTDAAIYRAAGEEKLLSERKKIGEIKEGDAKSTPAFKLDAKYIIHTVGPVWIDGNHGESDVVRNCYKNSLNLASKLKCDSIAFPLIATGVYGFPKAEALKIAIAEFSDFLSANEMEIILVVFDNKSFELSGKIFAGIDSYIDDNYVEDKRKKEYEVFEAIEKNHRGRRIDDKIRRRKTIEALPMEEAEYEEGFDIESMPDQVVVANMAKAEMAPLMGVDGSLDDFMKKIMATWQERLFQIIDEKEYDEVEVYKRANVDRKLFSKIRSKKDYQPKKITAVAFALALRLNIDETRDFLQRAGFAFSPSSKFDLIIQYFIKNEVYDIYVINLALFEHEQPTLGC